MAEIMVYIWLAVVVLSLVGEAATMDMTSIWFAVGGVCSIIAWCIWNTDTGSIILQVVLFVCVSLVCLCTLRKVCKNFLLRKDNEKTNASSLVGTRTKLLTDILDNQKGTLKLNDVVWACVSEDDSEIPAGETVEIVKINGNKLVVNVCKKQLDAETEKTVEEVNDKKSIGKTKKRSTFKDEGLL